MQPRVILGTAAAAAVGAAAWAAVIIFFNYEVGYVAWGIGALVGWAAAAFGGRGWISGGTAAVFALLAILGGKAIPIQMEVGEVLHEDAYQMLMHDAESYPGTSDRAVLRTYVVEHGFNETESNPSDGEIDQFIEDWDESLTLWKNDTPDYEEWVSEQFSLIDLFDSVKDNLDLFDLLFLVLGISTAFKLAGRPEELFSEEFPIDDDAPDEAPADSDEGSYP
jgi:hypothetical protein